MTKSLDSLQGQRALITGAAGGLGTALAQCYGQAGADLILVDQDAVGLERVDDLLTPLKRSVTLVPFNLRQFASIDELADQVTEHFGWLDILVGNAAVLGALMPLTHLSHDHWHEVWQVNFMANWHLLKAFEPLLRQSPAGRAIFITADAAQAPSPFWGAYGLSKQALESMVQLYGAENATSTVKVNALNPGPIQSLLYTHALPGVDPATLISPKTLYDWFLKLASPSFTTTGQVYYATQ